MAGAKQGSGIDVDGLAAAHRKLVSDGATQFDLPTYQPPPQPTWLQPLLEWLMRAGPFIKFLFYAGVATLAVLIIVALYRWLVPIIRRRLARSAVEVPDDSWRPEAAPARALIAEADQLAADGAYAEAAHLLLLRSIEHIEVQRPGSLRPSFTSRDIGQAPILPPDIARAFRFIAGVVESGLFAGRPVDGDAWRDCRSAYEAAAFGGSWR